MKMQALWPDQKWCYSNYISLLHCINQIGTISLKISFQDTFFTYVFFIWYICNRNYYHLGNVVFFFYIAHIVNLQWTFYEKLT